MKQFRITGIDNRTNKSLQAMVEAPDEAAAYIIARKLFASVDRIDRMASAPVAPAAEEAPLLAALAKEIDPEFDDDEEEEEEEDEIPDLSGFDPEGPRSPGTLKTMLRRYQGQNIGINILEPDKFAVAKLISVSHEFITVRAQNNPMTFHFPIRGILAVMESSPDNPTPSVKSSMPGLFVEIAPTRIFQGVMAHAPKN